MCSPTNRTRFFIAVILKEIWPKPYAQHPAKLWTIQRLNCYAVRNGHLNTFMLLLETFHGKILLPCYKGTMLKYIQCLSLLKIIYTTLQSHNQSGLYKVNVETAHNLKEWLNVINQETLGVTNSTNHTHVHHQNT